ncbi:MAG: DUF1826 domain-containing protein [Gammaproteobacteria bacterium]|nr:MAG: DUF1826 domain-containing protein [Gammaproteobacteria bacterium]
MAAQPNITRTAIAPSSRIVEAVADLALIYEPDVNLCLLPRELSPEVQAFTAAARTLPIALNGVLPAHDADWAAWLAGYARLPGHAAFIRDVAALAELYASLLEPDALGARLHQLSGPMCPRLHVDRVGIRLLCTYAGPGTEWLDDPLAERQLLGPGAGGLSDEASGLIREPADLRVIPAGAIALLKGEAFPDNVGGGVIHRSPHDPAPRLLFSLDAVWQD